ncbi:MAG: HAMP domain-containing protein [Candidatus Omnitrophica bacterium]|nr:HAMP domain-containing protein [Candidatus Omnitrophota bacterium]
MERKRYRRRQYIVRKEFQLKYVGLILAVMLLSVAITGYTIYYNSWILLGDKLANVYPQGRLVHIFKTVNFRLAVSMVFVTILCTGIGIIASHKVAGPIYRMIKFIDSVAEGDYSKRLKLRKGDELTDVAGAINRLVNKLEGEKKS